MNGHAVLEARALYAGYGDVACVRDINLRVDRGEVVALVGPNGSGKSTTLLTLAGELAPIGGQVFWKGAVKSGPLHRASRDGLAFVPEGRSVFMSMTVRDNLLVGRGGVAPALVLFPELERLLNRRAGLLSGGEQQMLSLARALAMEPECLLVDELSLGLAPIVVERLIAALRSAATERGISVLLVEQQARRVAAVADRWYLLRNGSVIGEGDAASGMESLEEVYL